MLSRGLMIAAGVLCLVVAAYLIYLMARPSKEYGPELTPLRLTLAKRLVPEAVGDMRGRLNEKFFKAVLLHFEGDRNAIHLRNMVEKEIVGQKSLNLLNFEDIADKAKAPKGWIDQAEDFAKSLAASAVGGIKLTPDEKVSEAVKAAGMDGYVGGEVHFLDGSAEEERLDLTLYATDVHGAEVFRRQYTTSLRKSLLELEYFRFKMGELGVFWKILMWVTLTLVLPVVTYGLPAKALKSESNGAVLGALAGYTVVDVLFALFLMGFALSGLFAFFALLLALGLSAFYNWAIFTEIKDMV